MASRIDGLVGNRGVAIDKGPKPSGTQGNVSSGSNPKQANEKPDTVALTAEAKSLQQIGKEILSQDSYMDRERIEAIKESIANGKYAVDSERVAEKFLETERQLGKI